MENCKNWKKYKGIYPPKCNKGKSCPKCDEIYKKNQNKIKILSPIEFLKVIKETVNNLGKDKEALHGATDTLMENLLISIGYEEAIKKIRATTRWYS